MTLHPYVILNPCPNCGAPGVKINYFYNKSAVALLNIEWHKVSCTQCGKQTESFKTAEEAVAAWNRSDTPQWSSEVPTEVHD